MQTLQMNADAVHAIMIICNHKVFVYCCECSNARKLWYEWKQSSYICCI